MLRKYINWFMIFALILSIVIQVSISKGAETSFVYSEVSKDVSDISFYQPPENNATYKNIKGGVVKNVILMIGDGMGLNQLTLSSLNADGPDDKLYIEKLPIVGIMKTHSADSLVTDSAASGTALSCGIKTNNGMIGMNPKKTAYKNILELCKAKQMKTGLVATSTITHATPASFGSHVSDRGQEAIIASHLFANRINLLFGGGKDFWLPKSEGGERKDNRNLIVEAKKAGYHIALNRDDIQNAEGDYILGLLENKALTTFSPESPLPELTDKAIEILSQKPKEWFVEYKGFFLMVEGSQIDWACHNNNTANCIKQTLLFDLAVKEAIEFAMKDKQTLVIVTADHETGGLTTYENNLNDKDIKVNWASDAHSGSAVPVYAFGPKSDLFSGVYDNTQIPKKIADVLGIKKFPQKICPSGKKKK